MEEIINDQTEEGKTVLHLAIEKGDHELCSFLLKKGAKTDVLLKNGDSTLLLAIKQNNGSIVKLLL